MSVHYKVMDCARLCRTINQPTTCTHIHLYTTMKSELPPYSKRYQVHMVFSTQKCLVRLSNSFDILHKLLNLIVQSFLSFLLHLIELGCIFVTIGSDNSSGDRLPVYNSSKGETEENKEKWVMSCQVQFTTTPRQ